LNWSHQPTSPTTAITGGARTLSAALRQNPESALAQYGRRLGLSRTHYCLISDTGRVVALSPGTVALAFNSSDPAPAVLLESGPIFGNAVRDGTGLLDVSQYPNSQDFNAISSEINQRIERLVLPALRTQAVLGATLRFAGCAEITDLESDSHPLRVVPFLVEFP
jgi:predicted lipoprotein